MNTKCKILVMVVLSSFLSVKCSAQTAKNLDDNQVEKQCRIQNKVSGNVLRPQNASWRNDNPIVLFHDINWACVTWSFVKASENSYVLVNQYTNKSIKPGDDSPTNGTQVVQTPYDKSKPELNWEFISLENGFYKIKCGNNDLFLSSTSKEGEEGSAIVLAQWENKPEQMWKLIDKPDNEKNE